jgi:hypothetical protein
MSADPHPLPGSHRQSQKLCCQCCYFPFGLLVFLTSDSRCRKSKPRGSCHFRPGPCKYSSLLGSRSGLARAMALKKEFVNQREI